MQKLGKIGIMSILTIAVLAVLIVSGCGGDTTATTTTTAATTTTTAPATTQAGDQVKYEKALGDAITAQEELETYQYDMVLNMDMDITGGETPGAIMMKTTTAGGFNQTTKEMSMVMSISMEGDMLGDSGAQTMGYAMYLLKDWSYMKVDVPGLGEQWMKTLSSGVDDDIFSSPAEQQLAVLDSPTTIKYLRSENINGVTCSVLAIEPTMEELAEWYNEQGNNQLADGVNYGDIIESFSILCYVTEDTSMLAKMTLNMKMAFNAAQASVADGSFDNMDVDVLMDMDIHDQNKPFTIVLPEEAAGATEVAADTFNSMQ
jgi:hypothetical protein